MMTSLERALRAIDHQRPDRVPVIPQAHVWAQYAYGSSSDECMYDGERYAEVQLQAWQDFGWDGIFVATDSVALAHSLGLEVFFTEIGAAPGPIGILDDLRGVDSLEIPDPRETRLNAWITATRVLAREVGDRVLILARADQGPFSLAAQLRGMQEWLLEVGYGTEAEGIHKLLDFCTRYILAFADLLIDAGAHVVTIGDALASGSLISPVTFEQYAFPYQRRIADAVQARGSRLSIHVCGNTNRTIGRLAETGAHIIEFDDPTDFEGAWQAAHEKVCLLGNVNTSEIITFGTAAAVTAACRARLERVKPESGYILSSGCAISSNAPAENLHAMVESAQLYGQYDVG
ncbi:MAG: uroporphyrinogen decarboxylase family protein [Caldilineaceae bacterium]|nr:uroporphyrinogen decarboxylase family protein [Caldilineaceae bacterium]